MNVAARKVQNMAKRREPDMLAATKRNEEKGKSLSKSKVERVHCTRVSERFDSIAYAIRS